MKEKIIRIICIVLTNFKGIRNLRIDFGNRDIIHGANGTGKTTVNDAFTWVLFGKDSLDRQKFELRPRGANKDDETSVYIELSVTEDGREQKCSLKRSNAEKWTKKRGTTEYIFSGYANSYEVNGVPKTEGEYKAFIANIMDEEEFKLLTNPDYFMGLDAKKRRAMLIALCGDLSDEKLLEESDEDFDIAKEDIINLGLDDAKAKASKEYKLLCKQSDEYEPRIAEVEQNMPPLMDMTEALELRDEMAVKLESITAEILALEQSTSSIELNRRRNELTVRASEIAAVARKSLADEKQRLYGNFLALQNRHATASTNALKADFAIQNKQSEIKAKEAQIAETETMLVTVEAMVFDVNAQGACQSCGQMLPVARVQSLKEAFEANKQAKRKSVNAVLTKATMELGVLNTSLNVLERKKQEYAEEEQATKILLADADKVYRSFETEPDLSGNTTYTSVMAEIAEIDGQLAKIGETEARLRELRTEADTLRYDHSDMMRKIAESEASNKNREAMLERLESLRADYRTTGQEIATLECKLDELEAFSRLRSDAISARCNSLFSVVHVEMFENQINGGVREICDLSYDGVSYNGSLNNGHKIVAGLDVIRAFQTKRGVFAPIFLDNAESINDFNIPSMECQMILLKVDDNKELKVERDAW